MDGIAAKILSSSDGAKELLSPLHKTTLVRRGSNARVIKSRYMEAAASRRLADSSSSGNNSSGQTSTGSNKKKQIDRRVLDTNNRNPADGNSKKVVDSSVKNTVDGSNKKNVENKNPNTSNTDSATKARQRQLLDTAEKHSVTRKVSNNSGSISSIAPARPRARTKLFTANSKDAYTANHFRTNNGPMSRGCSGSYTNVAGSSVSSKLHSTAVNATLLNTTELPGSTAHLSSTVVSQRGRSSCSSFPDLPDISVIKIDSSGQGDSSTSPMLSSLQEHGEEMMKESPCDTIIEVQENQEITQEDLDVIYLNYLTWVNLNLFADVSQAATVESLKRETCFLQEQLSNKEQSIAELRQAKFLLDTSELAHHMYEKLIPVLKDVNDGSSWCSDMQALAHQLENHLHQVTLSPAVMPDSADDIINELKNITNSINDLLGKAPARTSELQVTSSVLDDIHKLHRCYQHYQEAACLVLEHCSLKLTPEAVATT